MLPSKAELRAEQARRSLLIFLQEAWPWIEPASPFVSGLHVEAICTALEDVLRGNARRLLVNVPPRHGKSLIASVAFPAWAWASRPELRFLYASYGEGLAVRDSTRTRRLLESAWFQERWGGGFRLSGDQNAKARFENDRGGMRLATSVGGASTGEGGDVIVIDDPHKIEQASSAAQRAAVCEWFDSTISTRLNDPRAGAIVVIGQRLNERDLFGHLLAQGGWEHLCLPAEYEPVHPFLWVGDPREQAGELLWPGRFGRAEIAALKRQLGSYGAAAQLQQLPSPARGGIFERRWWRWYQSSRPPVRLEQVLQSWDLAFSGGPSADYVVGQAWGIAGANAYLLTQVRAQLGFSETLSAIRQLTGWLNGAYPDRRGHAIYVEQAANGAAVLDVLRHEIPGVIAVLPQGDKVSRAYAVSPQVEAGNVHLPGAPDAHGYGYDRARTPAWVQTFVEEAASFPAGAHDDQVDAMTQALSRARRGGMRIRVLGGPGLEPLPLLSL